MTPEIEKRIKLVQAGKVPAGYKRTKIGIVPKEWSICSFGSLSSKTGRKKRPTEDFPVYSINNQKGFCSQSEQFENDGYSNTSKDSYTLVEKGDFAYNPARINIGSIGLLKTQEKVIISSLYVCFKLNSACNKDYFESYFKSYRFNYDVTNYTEGSVRQYLFYDNFAKISVAVPPIKEQEKIAEILAAQDRVIELKEKLIAEKKKQKKILVRYLLSTEQKTRRLFALGNIKINKGKWNRVQLNSLLEFKNGVNVDKDKFGSGVKMISVMDILSGKPINYDSIQGSVELSQEELSVYAVDYGDILFQRSSENYEDAGSSNVYIDKNRRATFSGFVIRGKKISEYEPYCLNAILKIPEVRRSIMRKAAGAQHVNIGQEALASIQINLPSLPEQQAIAKVLSTVDEEISLLQKDLEQEKLKKKSLMQLLLTGLVRVSA